MLTKLQLNWQSLLKEYQVNETVAQAIFFDLVKLYSNPQRFYHNLKHIAQVLEVIESLRPQAENIVTIQLAAWFHDVIYDSTAKDNEEKSSEYAESALQQLKIPTQIIYATKQLILNTKTHLALENDIDSQILLDADMSILGADDCDYKQYTQAIGKEYAWLSEEQYRFGRKNFLQQVLQRERIYFTNQLFSKLEIKARENISKEIEILIK